MPAYDLFVSKGIGAVKVMPLAKKRHLPRTGFYRHFKDLSDLHDAIIKIWQTRNTGIVPERCAALAQSLCAVLLNLIDCWIDTDRGRKGHVAEPPSLRLLGKILFPPADLSPDCSEYTLCALSRKGPRRNTNSAHQKGPQSRPTRFADTPQKT